MRYNLHDLWQKSLKMQFNFWAQSSRNAADALKLLEKSGLFPGAGAAAGEAEAAEEFWNYLAKDHPKPAFGIDKVKIGSKNTDVTETPLKKKPFATLKHFRRDCKRNDPKVLIVPPTSGHYATMMRDTVKGLLPAHEVYILDWENARDVPQKHGEFGLAEYIDEVRAALEEIGGDVHIIGFSQSTVPVLAATALNAQDKNKQDKNKTAPVSMTLMGGPVDTDAAKSPVTEYARQKSLDWFEKNVIMRVPEGYKGAGRKVYPGFLQLAGLMSLDAEKHGKNRDRLITALRSKDTQKSGRIKEFYDEYLAVSDLPAKFYLDTIRDVFQTAALARGKMTHRGVTIDPAAVTDTALFTVSGKKDEIVPPAQTEAAQKLCKNIPDALRKNLVHDKAGHYDLGSGKIWKNDILPELTAFIRDAAKARGLTHDAPPKPSARRSKTPKRGGA